MIEKIINKKRSRINERFEMFRVKSYQTYVNQVLNKYDWIDNSNNNKSNLFEQIDLRYIDCLVTKMKDQTPGRGEEVRRHKKVIFPLQWAVG